MLAIIDTIYIGTYLLNTARGSIIRIRRCFAAANRNGCVYCDHLGEDVKDRL